MNEPSAARPRITNGGAPMRSYLSSLLLVVLLVACALLGGCATGDAGAGADTATRSHSGGVMSFERADRVEATVTVTGWPSGMDAWTPEQITAFVAARGKAGPGVGFGEIFSSRQDVSVGADLAGGRASADNRVPVTTALEVPEGTAGGAAAAAAEALGIGKAAAELGDEPAKDDELPAEGADEPPAAREPEPAPDPQPGE